MTGTDRVCLMNDDADRLLESCAVSHVTLEETSFGARDFSANADVVKRAVEHWDGASHGQINVLVGDWHERRINAAVTTHYVVEPLPPGSILHVQDELYTVSAKCNLLMQAKELHLVDLCKILGRYWGTFSNLRDPERPDAIVERSCLATEHELLEYLPQVKKTQGHATLQEATRFTCKNAASPQEVNLQLALCLPASCNGFALCKPEMNHVVKLEETERDFYDAEYIKIDLYWPRARFGLEYLGEKEHESSLLPDVARWYAAKKKGIDLWFVTKEQLYDARALDFVAREVARRTGKKIVSRTWPRLEEIESLIGALSGSRILKPSDELRTRPLRQRR